MRLSMLCYFMGSLLSGIAGSFIGLIGGMVLLGSGIGFSNEAVPLFLSEIAPVNYRGAVNVIFPLFVTIGIFCTNYFISKFDPWTWRVAIDIVGILSLVFCGGVLFIPNTPISLIECGELQRGRRVFEKIRRTEDVDAEFNQMVVTCQLARQVKNPFKKLAKPSSRPPLVIAILLQLFQQFTGINAIMFFAPVLFQTVGFKNDASLLSSVVIGLVNVISTFVSISSVDKFGRRALLLQGCCQMFITQIIIGAILLVNLKDTNSLGRGEAMVVLLLVCLYVMSFAWSWGPLAGWLIPSETFPLETRPAGFAFALSSNILFTRIIAHASYP